MPSFEKALDLGADGIEFDVGLSRDGVPVVIHDDTLERTTNGSGRVEDMDFDELRCLDAGSWKGTATRLPSLEDVLEGFASRTLLNLEIKTTRRRAELVDACAEAVRKHAATGSVVFSSFDHDALRLLRRVMPEARIGVLAESTGLDRALACAAEIAAANLHPPVLLVSRGLVEAAHAASLRVWTWTVNAPRLIDHALACGVDGIFSDFPERIIAAREGRRPLRPSYPG